MVPTTTVSAPLAICRISVQLRSVESILIIENSKYAIWKRKEKQNLKKIKKKNQRTVIVGFGSVRFEFGSNPISNSAGGLLWFYGMLSHE